jgi:hypothetical protein
MNDTHFYSNMATSESKRGEISWLVQYVYVSLRLPVSPHLWIIS